MTLVIIGIGQSLRGDDGAGVAAVTRWQTVYPTSARQPFLRTVLAELTGLALLDELLDTDAAVLVDAVRSGSKSPGSLHILREVDLAAFGAGSASAHGLGVAETLALGRQIYPERMPVQVILIGIEVEDISLGEALSLAVSRSLPAAADLIETQVQRLQKREIRE